MYNVHGGEGLKRYVAQSTDALRRAAVRGTLAAAAVSALFLGGLLAPGSTESAGPFDVGGRTTKLQIFYHGVCNPGTLQTQISAAQAMPFTIDVSADIFGCIGTEDDPFVLLIDSELFTYANIHTQSTNAMTATVQPSVSSPFTLEVQNTSEFPTSGEVYVGSERITYAGKTATSLNVTARAKGATTKEGHAIGSFVRLQGKLKLGDRAQPTYADGDPVVVNGVTLAAKHQVGATVRSPKVQLTCRARLNQTDVPGGPDTIASRTRCYSRLEPDGPWPDPYPGPLLALVPQFYHDISTGTINDEAATATTTLILVTGIQGFDCFPFVENQLWVKITEEITVDKTPLNKDAGAFRISVFTNGQCTGDPHSVLGGADGMNVNSTEVSSNTDTDKDGCTDFRELGTDEADGAKRDPFNGYDYFDVNHDGAINIFDDIIEVANAFGPVGQNDPRDRGPRVPDADGIDDPTTQFDGPGPSDWNRSPPDGVVNIFDDILVVAGQFGNSCPHSHPFGDTPFGTHP